MPASRGISLVRLLSAALDRRVAAHARREIPEDDLADNVFPAAGPRTLNVQGSYPHRVVLIPVHHPSTGLTGNITSADTAHFVGVLRKLFPLPAVETTVRQTFTSSADSLTYDDSNGGG